MSNGFTKVTGWFGHNIKTGAEDVAKVAIWVPEHMIQIKVLDSVAKDSPAVKAELKTLIGKVVSLDILVRTTVHQGRSSEALAIGESGELFPGAGD
jgi:hypothetical protein